MCRFALCQIDEEVNKDEKVLVAGYHDDRIFKGDYFHGMTDFNKGVDVYSFNEALKLPFVEPVTECEEWDSIEDWQKMNYILTYVESDKIASIVRVATEEDAIKYKQEVLEEINDKEQNSIFSHTITDAYGNFRKVYVYRTSEHDQLEVLKSIERKDIEEFLEEEVKEKYIDSCTEKNPEGLIHNIGIYLDKEFYITNAMYGFCTLGEAEGEAINLATMPSCFECTFELNVSNISHLDEEDRDLLFEEALKGIELDESDSLEQVLNSNRYELTEKYKQLFPVYYNALVNFYYSDDWDNYKLELLHKIENNIDNKIEALIEIINLRDFYGNKYE